MFAQAWFTGRTGVYAMFCALLLGLSACRRDVVIPSNPSGVLEFKVCQQALATLPKRGGYQGYQGWFYFTHDFWTSYPNLQETDFFVRMKEVLKSQGVELVLMPVASNGMVNPEFLYREDPQQAAFSATQAQTDYESFVATLRAGGLEVIDALAAMQTYSAAGGQPSFKRDDHWAPDGANAVLKEAAHTIKRLAPRLPASDVKLTRVSPDSPYYGEHINSWLNDLCGHHLPPEPLKNYVVAPSTAGDKTAEVVQTGTSFSIPPYDPGFLSVWLQSPVYNASMGGGGLVYPLEAYLRGDVYTAHHPKVIVWEFPLWVHPLVEPQKRKLIAAAYGLCHGGKVAFQKTYRAQSTLSIADFPALTGSGHYLSFTFSDLAMTRFEVDLRYRGVEPDTFSISHPRPDASVNSGRFFAMLRDTPAPLESLTVSLPETVTGKVTVQLCQVP